MRVFEILHLTLNPVMSGVKGSGLCYEISDLAILSLMMLHNKPFLFFHRALPPPIRLMRERIPLAHGMKPISDRC